MGKMFHAAESGELRVLDHTGDTRMAWDKADPATIVAAKEFFDKHLAKGFLAFRVPKTEGEKAQLMKAFDPNTDIVLSPALTPG